MKVDQNQINKWKEKGLSVVERMNKVLDNPKHKKMKNNFIEDLLTHGTAKIKQPRRAKKQNKTESAYALQLEALKQVGEIAHYEFEAITLKLADGTRYTPDFFIVSPNGHMSFAEVKGAFIFDDSKVKFKVARKMFPWFKFRMMQWKDKVWTELYPE